MLSISHTLTGAFIATKTSNPIVYVPLIFASHYLEDWIPHWDVGTGLSNGKRNKKTAIMLEIGELIISVFLVYFFWNDASEMTLLHAGIGAFTGLIPDFLEAPRNFLKWEPKFLTPFNKFHGKFHHSTANMILGLVPQLLLVLTIYLLK